jgi:hypothetical protein
VRSLRSRRSLEEGSWIVAVSSSGSQRSRSWGAAAR